MSKITISAVKRVIKEFYPDDMVSKKALERIVSMTEDFIRMTYIDAKKYTEARGKKIIMEKDVILASS